MNRGSEGPPVTFYTISSALYFPGFVGMLNSLRLAGHHEPVTVLERGMSRAQKTAIERHCTVVSLSHQVQNPCHLTAFPSQLDVCGIAVFIDSDALVLGRLDEAIAAAARGKIAVYRDPDDSRVFEEWATIFGLQAPLRDQPYFNTGFVAFSVEAWPTLLGRWWDLLERVWDRPSFMEGASMDRDPTSQPDQDAFNALLMSEVPAGSVHELPAGENVFPSRLPNVTVGDLASLSCTAGGDEVRIVQCSGSPKPWTWAAVRARRDTYCFLPLLRRVLAESDGVLSVPRRLLPPWLRRGLAGEVAYGAVLALLRAPGPRQLLRSALGRLTRG